MSKILVKSMKIQNFKGIKELNITFGDSNTYVSGRNASGKSSVVDAFFWCMFDKDSNGNSSFAIRPKDEYGRDVDNIEIVVETVLDMDGEQIVLTKTQKQKWTKKRGHESRVFEGNENVFMVNHFPSKKSEYEQNIHSLIDESLFKLLTNPRTFASMKWQDQRKILLKFVSEITDEDILNDGGEKYEPIREDVIAAGADKAREKAMVALKSLKKEQAEYPVRVDEASRNITQNLPEEPTLTEHKAQIESELQAVQNSRNSLLMASNAITDIQKRIFDKRRRMAEIERSAMLEDEKRNLGKTQEANDALTEVRKVENQRDSLCTKVNFIEAAIRDNKERVEKLFQQGKAISAEKFDENETICPTCKRPYEPDRVTEMKASFKESKQKRITTINDEGKSLVAKVKEDTAKVEEIKSQIATLTETVKQKNSEWEALKEKANHSEHTDVTTIPEYKQLQTECDELDRKLASMDNTDSVKEELLNRENELYGRLDEINEALTAIRVSAAWQQRVEELKEAQMDCGQKVADQEQIVYLLEEFIKAKMDILSDRINSHFKKVRWRLFTEQINGGIKEACVMQINSNGSYVDYTDANNAARIIGGLDVIEALSELYGVYAPIFLDNAEALDSFSTPQMEAQLILLEVSDDKELVFEYE